MTKARENKEQRAKEERRKNKPKDHMITIPKTKIRVIVIHIFSNQSEMVKKIVVREVTDTTRTSPIGASDGAQRPLEKVKG